MGAKLPEVGQSWDALRDEMLAMRREDLDWRRGRHSVFVWHADDELEAVLREAYGLFLVENGLGLRAFPSLRRMEEETLAIVRGLLSADDGAAGVFTSGGTESIFLAVQAARAWSRETRPHVATPGIVAPFSAHPALSKAAHLLGLSVTRVPVGPDHRANAAAMEAAITPDTAMLYASAPTYSLGVVDPIEAVGALAEGHGLWLHVDACVGGILAPFVRDLGHPVPAFDFAVPGVTSISADLHKSGFAAKPASTVTFRTERHRELARYATDEWPSGLYSSLTFTGTRPGGAIAAAWAALNFLGREGYRRIAAASMRARARMVGGLTRIPTVRVFGEPDLWAFAFGSDAVDMHRVAARMGERGWYCGRTTSPRGIHMMCTPVHEKVAAEYVADIERAIDEERTRPRSGAGAAVYS
jgi:glutamate/tyrosine decarboxylase-like PLP-dependent enzyme